MVPCKFCGKPLESELACPRLVEYRDAVEHPLPGDPAEILTTAEFRGRVVRVVGKQVVSTC
jgi:hypothetical protein